MGDKMKNNTIIVLTRAAYLFYHPPPPTSPLVCLLCARSDIIIIVHTQSQSDWFQTSLYTRELSVQAESGGTHLYIRQWTPLVSTFY